MHLTEHFTLAEFNKHNFDLTTEIKQNLKELAIYLELFRGNLGDRIVNVNSGYRTPEYNRRIGGVKGSYHTKGKAADIKVKGLSPAKVQALAIKHWPGGVGCAKTFTHLDLGPKRTFTY